MRRRILVVVLIVAAGIWGLSARASHDVLAQDTAELPLDTPAEVPSSENASIIEPEPVPVPDVTPVAGEAVMAAPASLPEPLYLSEPAIAKQWALNKMEIPRLWGVTTGSDRVTVAVLDTGIDTNHEDLEGQVSAEANFTDSPIADSHGHGTHIAGIIAALDNGRGIVGIAPGCSLLNVKVADDTGRCSAGALAEGITWAVNNGASVINVSVEIREASSRLEQAVRYAWDHDVLIVAAAGNDGGSSPVYPAAYDSSLAVAATDPDDSLAQLSNHADWVDVAAPGADIYSTLPDNEYGYKSGTSFACAYVSGIAALLYSVATDTNGDGRLVDEVVKAIEAGCDKLDLGGVGQGRVNATQILSQLQ